MKTYLIIGLTFVFLNSYAQQQYKKNLIFKSTNQSEWVQTNGPGGGFVHDIVFDPYNESVLYAIGSSEGIYKSINSGESWEYLRFTDQGHANNLEASNSGSGVLFSNHFNLSKSTDGGLTWDECSYPFGDFISAQVFKVDPLNSDYIYVAGNRFDGNGIEIYKSEDLGETWENITNGLVSPVGSSVTSIALKGDEKVFIGINDNALTTWHKGKVFYTENDGETWQEIDFGQTEDRFIQAIIINSADSSQVWISERTLYFDSGLQPCIYLSNDGGNNWEPVNVTFLPQFTGQPTLLGTSANGKYLFIGYGDGQPGYVNTQDEIKTFYAINFPPEIVHFDLYNVAPHPDNEDVLYIPSGSGGVAYTEDLGQNWIQKNNGILNTSLNLLASDPKDPGTIYCSSWIGEGTFRTKDYGLNWEFLNTNGIVHPWNDELYVEPKEDSNVWFISDVPYIHKSSNKGDSWKVINHPYEGGTFNFNSIYTFGQSSADPNTMYALNNGFGYFKGTRNSATRWNWDFLNLSDIDYSYTMVVHPTDPNTIYSGYQPKPFQDWAMVQKSIDGGASWDTSLFVNGSSGIMSITMDPNDPNILYAGSTGKQGEVYKTINGGSTWSKLNEQFTMLTVWGQAQLIVHPTNPDIAYATSWLGGTWKTSNAGFTWEELENAPASGTSISVNAANPDILFISDRTDPIIWKSIDGGNDWTKCIDFSQYGALLAMRVFSADTIVYASTFSHGLRDGKIYKSIDLGNTWTDASASLPKGVLDINIDTKNTDNIYVTTNINGSFKSTDGGQSWQKMNGFPDIGAYDIEIDHQNQNVLFAAGRGGSLPDWFTQMSGDNPTGIVFTDTSGIYMSTDNGLTWNSLLTTHGSCRTIRQHPTNSNLLYAIDTKDGLMMSNNGGEEWQNIELNNNQMVLTSCAVNNTRIYVGTQGCGVFCGDLNSETGEVIWKEERSNKPVPVVKNMQITIDPTNSDRIFVSSNPGGLYRSDNGGGTFADKNAITPSVIVEDAERQGYYSFALNPSNPDETWIGTWGKGIYKSYDGMNYNTPMFGADHKMVGKHIYKVIVDPADGNTVYASSQEGVFRTTDGGDSWQELNNGLISKDVISISINSNNEVFAGTKGYGMYYLSSNNWESINGFGQWGTFWPMWNNRPMYQYTSLLVHPIDNERVILGTFPQGIYKSTDGGDNWRESNVGWTNDGVFRLVCHPADPQIVYAGTYNGMNRSVDFGEHWQIWDEGIPPEQWVFSIDFDPINPDIMYACSKNGENEGTGRDDFRGTIVKSINGGETWYEITDGLPLDGALKDQEFYQIIVDRFNSDIIYLVGQHDGILKSEDAGSTWNYWNDGLTNHTPGTNGNNVTNTLVLSSDNSMLYFGTSGSGVWRRMIAPILAVDNLSANMDNHTINLNWSFEDFNNSFVRYNIYRANEFINSVDNIQPIYSTTTKTEMQYSDNDIEPGLQYFYAVTAEDDNGYENPYFYTLGPIVDKPLQINTASLDSGMVGVLYSDTILIQGGQSPFIFNIKEGTLPNGLTINNKGIVSGTPTIEGEYVFEVIVADNQTAAFKDSCEYTIFIREESTSNIEDYNELSASIKIYPNPFTTSVTIDYYVIHESDVKIEAYNSAGKIICIIENEHKKPGSYSVKWNSIDYNNELVNEGVFLLKLRIGDMIFSRKIVMITN